MAATRPLRVGRAEDVAFEQRLAVPAGEDHRDRRAEAGAGHAWKRRHIASSRSWPRIKDLLTRGEEKWRAGPKAGMAGRPSRARLR
jgi:hypothetical protein